jgi:hypothetical protein
MIARRRRTLWSRYRFASIKLNATGRGGCHISRSPSSRSTRRAVTPSPRSGARARYARHIAGAGQPACSSSPERAARRAMGRRPPPIGVRST